MTKYALFLGLLLFVTTCKKVNLDLIQNLNGNKILVIGHAGDGFQTGRHPIPSNSETSITKAIEMHNADGCEMDVILSKDSVPMLFHDDELEKSSDCSGCIPEKTFEELKNCRYKEDFSVNNFQEEKIITMEKIFEKYSDSPYQPVFCLDIKTSPSCGKESEAYLNLVALKVTGLISRYHMENKVFVHCGSWQFLNKVKAINPALRLVIDVGSGDFNEGINFATQNNFFGVEARNNVVSKEQVSEAHSNNLWVFVFGLKTRSDHMEAIEKSVDVMETDNIPLLQEILKK